MKYLLQNFSNENCHLFKKMEDLNSLCSQGCQFASINDGPSEGLSHSQPRRWWIFTTETM